jgi:hypothetical protein
VRKTQRRNAVDVAAILAKFKELRTELPHLTSTLSTEHPQVDLYLEFPKQDGLSFPVSLNLQGDELHLNVGDVFWVEWFPVDRPDVVATFLAIVRSLLSGEYRVIEYSRRGRCFKAQLQKPQGERWVPVATWGTWHLPGWWRTTGHVLRNLPPAVATEARPAGAD